MMTGDFIGKECEIYISTTPISKTVWRASVFLPKKESWRSLKSEYESLKEQYCQKYGLPESYEYFSDPYYEGYGYELQAVRLDKCTFFSVWEINDGSIGLKITHSSIMITYEDEFNGGVYTKEKNIKLQNEI